MAEGETGKRTIGDWLKELSETDTSHEEDSHKMQNFLRQNGFPCARVVMGIVYLEGHGTMEAPPTSIHSIAKMLWQIAEKQTAEAAKGV